MICAIAVVIAAMGEAPLITLLIPRPMPNAQDNHRIPLHPIAQHIRPDARHLAPSLTRIAPAFRKLREAVRRCEQPLAQPHRR